MGTTCRSEAQEIAEEAAAAAERRASMAGTITMAATVSTKGPPTTTAATVVEDDMRCGSRWSRGGGPHSCGERVAGAGGVAWGPALARARRLGASSTIDDAYNRMITENPPAKTHRNITRGSCRSARADGVDRNTTVGTVPVSK